MAPARLEDEDRQEGARRTHSSPQLHNEVAAIVGFSESKNGLSKLSTKQRPNELERTSDR
jgi:hypothetical protein